MNVLIISQFVWKTHLGTALELAQCLLDQGHEVVILGCDGSVGSCYSNQSGNPKICRRCSQLREYGLSLLDGPVEYCKISDFRPPQYDEIEIAREIEENVTDLSSLERFVYDGCKLGLGIASSLITESRNPNVDRTDLWSCMPTRLQASVYTYESVRQFLEVQASFDRAYLFNGRFDITNAALNACRNVEGMVTFTHERGASTDKYMTFEGATPHDRNYLYKHAVSFWDNCDDHAEREFLANEFFNRRILGADRSWKNFLEHQKKDSLPEEFDANRRNVVIFNSSEDEFVGLGPEWKNPIYESQSHGVEQIICDALLQFPDVHFYLRMHPNLNSVDNEDTQRLRRLADEGLQNFTYIAPDSHVSSYALLNAADAVLTFGSTIGIEATYGDKVSILAGHAFYELFDVTHQARDHGDVMRLLGDETLAPKSKREALIYGYYLVNRGVDFKYWEADGFLNGSFKGQCLTLPKSVKRVSYLRQFERKLRVHFKALKSRFNLFFS